MVLESPTVYDDEANCTFERSRRNGNTKTNRLLIYPNPATDWITVSYVPNSLPEQSFQLFNMLGQVVKTVMLPKDQNVVLTRLEEIPAGVYGYCITGTGTGMHSGKVMINR